MSGRLLLDTNAVIDWLTRDEEGQPFGPLDTVMLPCIVFGQLVYGAHNSGRPAQALARADRLALRVHVLECDAETARVYGRLKMELRRKGRPIPSNDLWIAALAVQHGMTLVTRDAHFGGIEGLRTTAW